MDATGYRPVQVCILMWCAHGNKVSKRFADYI